MGRLGDVKVSPPVLEHEEFQADTGKFFSGKLGEAVQGLSDHLRFLPEDELYERVNPTAIDWQLRERFTALVKQARATNQEQITATAVYEGIVTRQAFLECIIPSPMKIAWMSRPVIEHTAYYNAIHKICLRKLTQIAQKLPADDTKYLPQILKLCETAGNRVHGPVVQRMQIQSKNVNIDVPANAQGQAQLPGADDPEAIQRQIAELQQRLLTSAKDVTPKEDPSGA